LFSKIIGRDTAERREEGDNGAARRNASGDQGKAEQGEGRSGERHSLKEREYRDSDGNIHHHTNEYMDQHGSKA
jgi:hypothetical protein